MMFIGIDPGTSGAIAFLSPAGAKVLDLPTRDLPAGGFIRKRTYAPDLYQILMAHARGQQCVSGIEALASGGRAGFNMVQTQNAMHRTRGVIEATFELAGLALGDVPPKTWKGFYGLAGKQEDKQATDKALELAAMFYPDLVGELSRKKDHNRAEAVLIAHWLRRRHERDHATQARAEESVL